MAIKTFTTGEVLTAADTNSYLANSGLVYVTQVSPTASTAVQITNCFSSTYDNYRVIVTPMSTVNTSDVRIKLLIGTTPSSTGYYMNNIFASGTSITTNNEPNAVSFRGAYSGLGSSSDASVANYNSISFDIFGPFLALATRYMVQSSTWGGTDVINRSANGFHVTGTSYNGFELSAASNITCTVTVYGYRKA